MQEKEIDAFCPARRSQWRTWLTSHHQLSRAVWLIYYKKNTGQPTIAYTDAVDEALCFGWIDSTKRSIDEERFMQLFTPRKPSSIASQTKVTGSGEARRA